MDPLLAVPAEIVLRILDFTPVSGLASLTRLNGAWHDFIDNRHQDAIYASPSKTNYPPGVRDFSFLDRTQSFDRYFKGVSSWRDLCKRQTLFQRNYSSSEPQVSDNLMVPLWDANRVWRFRTDLQRRFFVCTSQDGGLAVTDVDGKGRLWHLDHHEVPPFAHLEYSDGMAVWSTLGDALEVWVTDEPGLARGEFRKVAVLQCPLHHLRGFHLAGRTLCVVGDDGQGLVYDITSEPPRLRLRIDIQEGAIGHLCQADDAVMYSMGRSGYHIHDKANGELLGTIQPSRCKRFSHIIHPGFPTLKTQIIPPALAPYDLHKAEIADVMTSIEVQDGPLPSGDSDFDSRLPLALDDWGAGLVDGALMVGISKAGRVLVCSDWREAIKNERNFEKHVRIIECSDNEDNFDLGGWLSIRDNRILCEIQDRVYIISLNEDGTVGTESPVEKRPSWCFSSVLDPLVQRRLQSGISMMALFDDCIVTTCWLPARSEGRWLFRGSRAAALPTKGIRILSLAPKLD